MILKRLYEEYDLSIEKILIKEFKRLNLTVNELAALLILITNKGKKNLFSLTAVAKRLDYSQNETALIIEKLIEKEFVKLDLETNNKREREVYNIDGTFNKIALLFLEDEKANIKEETSNNIEITITKLETSLGRMLKSSELERVRLWYENFKFNHNKIIETIEKAPKITSLFYIEKILNMELETPEKLDKVSNEILDNIFKKM